MEREKEMIADQVAYQASQTMAGIGGLLMYIQMWIMFKRSGRKSFFGYFIRHIPLLAVEFFVLLMVVMTAYPTAVVPA